MDDGFAFHPKAIMAGNAALGLWVRAGAWCGANLTDGALPRHMIGTFGAQARDARKLVEVGLWVETETGYQFHEWELMQPSKADVLEERAANKKRQQAWRDRQRNAVTNDVTNDVTNGVTNAAPTRPDPTHLTEEEAKASSRSTEPNHDEPKPANYPASFEAFWDSYPRKQGKKDAYKAFQKARKTATVQQLCTGAARYADDPNREDAFTAMPATWLNRGSWDDAPLPDRNATQTRPTGAQTRAQAGLARLAAYDANQTPRQLELGA